MRNSIPVILSAISALCLSAHLSAGTVHALSYETPAYIDFEFSEVTAVAGETSVILNLNRTGDFRKSTTIEYATEEITAVEGRDYKGSGGTITFKPGEGFRSIQIDLLANPTPLTNRSFRVKLSASGSTVLLRDAAVVKLEDSQTALAVRPRLDVAPGAPGSVILSWEGEHQILERSTKFTGEAWEPVDSPASMVEGRYQVSQPTSGAFYAYRLRGE
jgi:hypothetical protein